jgi:hypothetical protein
MTGADFKYLLATAQVESNLNPNAQVSTSSAKGLFQFIEQTWLTTLKEQGAALGYGPYANAITRSPSGQYAVSDERMYDRIMNLRTDPAANALMAGAFTKANAGKLGERLGRGPTEGELYIAHFLGATGAGRLISLADAAPGTPAATMFPSAARANPTIFYDGRKPRSVSEVYRLLVGRYDVARGSPPSTPTMIAGGADDAAARAAFAPDTAEVTKAYAAAGPKPAPAVRDTGPAFHTLFRTGATEEAVAPLVRALWNAPTPVADDPPAAAASVSKPKLAVKPTPLPEPAASPAATVGNGQIGLFQEQVPDARALFRGRV